MSSDETTSNNLSVVSIKKELSRVSQSTRTSTESSENRSTWTVEKSGFGPKKPNKNNQSPFSQSQKTFLDKNAMKESNSKCSWETILFEKIIKPRSNKRRPWRVPRY